MTLIWLKDRSGKPENALTEATANDYHWAHTIFGKFALNILEGRQYKDGTHEYLCRLRLHKSNSFGEFTLLRTRGHLLDAITATEKALFRYFHLPRMYRIPMECLDIDPAAKKLLERHPLCFACDCQTCALNPEGVCMYPILHGKAPDLAAPDGCTGYVEKREEG